MIKEKVIWAAHAASILSNTAILDSEIEGILPTPAEEAGLAPSEKEDDINLRIEWLYSQVWRDAGINHPSQALRYEVLRQCKRISVGDKLWRYSGYCLFRDKLYEISYLMGGDKLDIQCNAARELARRGQNLIMEYDRDFELLQLEVMRSTAYAHYNEGDLYIRHCVCQYQGCEYIYHEVCGYNFQPVTAWIWKRGVKDEI